MRHFLGFDTFNVVYLCYYYYIGLLYLRVFSKFSLRLLEAVVYDGLPISIRLLHLWVWHNDQSLWYGGSRRRPGLCKRGRLEHGGSTTQYGLLNNTSAQSNRVNRKDLLLKLVVA